MIKNKLIVGMDDNIWRKFVGRCYADGVKVADRLNDLLQEHLKKD